MQKLYIIFAAYLLCFVAKAQDNYRFQSYTINDGLPQSSIWDIIQDKHGFIWAGTSDGLCRFDGYRFTVYKNNPADSKTIVSSKDNHFFVDKQQRLWIVSAKGISIYNDATDDFTNILQYNPSGIQQSSHNCIYGEWDGYIWVGLNQYGLVKVNSRNLQPQQIKQSDNLSLTNYHFWLKGFIEDGIIYGNTEAGFFKYTIAANSINTIPQLPNSLSALNVSATEVLNCNSKHLIYINKKKLVTRYIPIVLPKGSDLVLDICINTADTTQIILATPVGLQYVNRHTGELVKTITDFDPDKKLKYSYASCFFTDRSGNFWIGTNGDGIRKMAFPFKNFKYYPSSSNKSSIVKGIYAAADKLFVGYFDNGIDVFDRKKGLIKHIDISTLGKSATNHVFNIVPFNDESLLINNFGENTISLLRYFPASGTTKDITQLFKKQLPSTLGFDHSHLTFYKATNGKIYGGCNEVLFSVSTQAQSTTSIATLQVFPNEKIASIYEDDAKGLWVGTYSSLYHLRNNKWVKINLSKNLLVKTICKDINGNIWAGTVEGIFIVDKNDHLIQTYTEQNGLLNNFIYGIIKDNQNNMWFSTNKGLGVYKLAEKKFRFFTTTDGLQANEFNTGAYFKAADGELFFGGINGTNSFHPTQIVNNPFVPKVKITSVKLFDEPYQTKTAYWNLRSIVLPHTDNSLSFEFVLPEFTNTQQNNYAYMMEGIDKNWIDAGVKRYTRYAGMQPGNYIFKVKACNEDGIWTSTETTISIKIIPPYWQQTWFIILAALILVSTIISIVVFIQKLQFKKRMQALEIQYKIQLERERISRDLHDNVGTQLSLISKSIHGMLQNDTNYSEEDQKQKLKLTGQNSLDVISALRETIWALNKESIALQEFFDKLKSFAQKQMSLNEQTKLWFTENITNVTVVLGPSEALHLFRICQESITNSLKYAQAKNITIHVETNKDKYSVCLTDDGRGFDKHAIDTAEHYGLENMKHRANEIACDLIIETAINKGTSIHISKK